MLTRARCLCELTFLFDVGVGSLFTARGGRNAAAFNGVYYIGSDRCLLASSSQVPAA